MTTSNTIITFGLLVCLARIATAQAVPTACQNRTTLATAPGLTPAPAAGASVGVIDSAALAPFAGHTLSEALTARLPGVSVMHSSGIAGAGARIRLRGPGGIVVTQQPLLFLDGIRVDGELHSVVLDAGGQAPSRVDDIPVENIHCIHVLRGPAATARYGTDAAGGVIHIVSRRPRTDSTRVQMFLEGGASTDLTDYPSNYGTAPVAPNGGSCSRAAAALGGCVAGPIRSWSPLAAADPFRTAPLLHGGLRASILAGERASLGVSGGGTLVEGPLRNNDARRYNAAATGAWEPSAQASVESHLWFIGGRSRLPQVGNFSLGILNSALQGRSVDDPILRGYRNAPLSVVERFGTDQDVRRIGGTAAVRWSPSAWLNVRALAGREDSRVRDEQFDPTFLFSRLPAVDPPRFLETGERRTERTSARVSAAARYGTAAVRLSTEIGVDHLDENRRRETRALDVQSPSSFSSETYSSADETTTGVTVRQELVVRDHLVVDAGVRHDMLDAEPIDDPTYPFASAAWDVVRSRTDGSNGAVSSLRFRVAYGESGNRPPFTGLFAPGPVVPPGGIASPSRWPTERTREVEAGFQVGLLADRVTVDATYFSKRTSDGLVPVPLPPGIGVPSTSGFGLASWQNRGVEIDARARVLNVGSVRADVALSFTTLDNELGSRGNQPPIISTYSRLVPGYPLFGLWGRPYTVTDANGDGVIVPAEVVADTGAQYLGSPVPTRELAVRPSIAIGRSVTVAAVIDHRGGFRVINSTGRLRCNGVCSALYMPNASPAEQARAVDPVDAAAGWIEDGGFVKLRELALSWTLPGSWSRRLGARSSSLVLAGRNLATATSYSGLDPEITYTGQAAVEQSDLFVTPLARTLSLRLDIGW